MDHVEGAVRQPRLGVQPRHQVRRGRVAFARLEHEGVSAGERDGVHPHRHHGGEVERGDAGDDAERLPEVVHVHAAGDLVGVAALEHVADSAGELDDLAASHHLAARVLDGLAVFGADEAGEFVLVPHQQVAEGEQHAGAAAERGVGPVVEGARPRSARRSRRRPGCPVSPGTAPARWPGRRRARSDRRSRRRHARRSSARWSACQRPFADRFAQAPPNGRRGSVSWCFQEPRTQECAGSSQIRQARSGPGPAMTLR